jgi:hypothetical protein
MALKQEVGALPKHGTSTPLTYPATGGGGSSHGNPQKEDSFTLRSGGMVGEEDEELHLFGTATAVVSNGGRR